MKSNKYDIWVETKDLIPPIGENKFYSKALITEIGVGEISHGLGEVHGGTRADSERKMNEKISIWLSENK